MSAFRVVGESGGDGEGVGAVNCLVEDEEGCGSCDGYKDGES